MTDEEIQQSVVEIMRLRLFGHESRAPEQVKEVLLRLIRTTYTEAIEEAAKVAFEIVRAIDNSPLYTTLQRAAQVAASVRRLIETEQGE